MNGVLLRLTGVDERALRAVVRYRKPRLDRVMRAVTRTADPVPACLTALVMSGAADVGVAAVGRVTVATLVLSHLFVQLVKRSVTRPRPPVETLIQTPRCFSFPSGHAAAGLSLVLPAALALPGPVGSAVLGLGCLVGVSRCYLGVHYPGDVIAGWLLTAFALVCLAVAGMPIP